MTSDAVFRRLLPHAFLKGQFTTLVRMASETPFPVVRNLVLLGRGIVNHMAGDTFQLTIAIVKTPTHFQRRVLPPQ
jgi:hypothetical protein